MKTTSNTMGQNKENEEEQDLLHLIEERKVQQEALKKIMIKLNKTNKDD